MSDGLSISLLDADDLPTRNSATDILTHAFADPTRYSHARIVDQLAPAPAPFYRHFFIARLDGTVVGVGGIKAADWASDTHILYLSAVAEPVRGRGIARALIDYRIAWAKANFAHGRLLVSTARVRRFSRLGFRPADRREAAGRRLMIHEF